MTGETESKAKHQLVSPLPSESMPRVIRSAVPPGKGYEEYRQYLRYDFWYSCGYCSITEAEAMAIRFSIDHYEPRAARRDLEHDYANLIYSCEPCNTYKGDRCPPADARAIGLRFFKADEDVHADHFRVSNQRLEGKTPTGEYTIEALDLNRMALRRLRDIRMRLSDSDAFIAEGIRALRHFPIDRLPPTVKGKATTYVKRLADVADRIADEIDQILRSHAKSELIDNDSETQTRTVERSKRLKDWQALYPGAWRAPRTRKG